MAYTDPRVLAGMSQASLSKYNLLRALQPGVQTAGNMANFGANQAFLRPGEEHPLGSPDFGDDFILGRNAKRQQAAGATTASAPPASIAAPVPQTTTPPSLVADTYGIARGQNADPLPDAHAVLRDFKRIGAGYGDTSNLPTRRDAPVGAYGDASNPPTRQDAPVGAYGAPTDKYRPRWYGAPDGWADGTPIDENNRWMAGIVQGPGGPKDDKVGPALLSDGEAIVPAKTVDYLNDAMGDSNGVAKLIYGTDTAPKNPEARAEQVAKVGGADAVKAFMAKQAGQPSVVRGKVVQEFSDGRIRSRAKEAAAASTYTPRTGTYSVFDNMTSSAATEAAARDQAQKGFAGREARAQTRRTAADAAAMEHAKAVAEADAKVSAEAAALKKKSEAATNKTGWLKTKNAATNVAKLGSFYPAVEGVYNILRDDSLGARLAHGAGGALSTAGMYTMGRGGGGWGQAIPPALLAAGVGLNAWGDSLNKDYLAEHPELAKKTTGQELAARDNAAVATPLPASAALPPNSNGIRRLAGSGTPSFTYDAAADTTPAAVPGQAELNAYTQALQGRDARIQKLGARSAALGDSGDVYGAEANHIATLRELASLKGGSSLDTVLGGAGGAGGVGGAGGKSLSQQVLEFAKGVQDMKVSQATAEENKAKLRNEENKHTTSLLTDEEKPLALKYATVMASDMPSEAKAQHLRDLALVEKAPLLTDPDSPHTLNDLAMLEAIKTANQNYGNDNVSGEGMGSFILGGNRARRQGTARAEFNSVNPFWGKNVPVMLDDVNQATLTAPLNSSQNEALQRLLSSTR